MEQTELAEKNNINGHPKFVLSFADLDHGLLSPPFFSLRPSLYLLLKHCFTLINAVYNQITVLYENLLTEARL